MKAFFLMITLMMGWSAAGHAAPQGEQSSREVSTNILLKTMDARTAKARRCRKLNSICWVNAQCCSGRCTRVTRRCRPVSGGYKGP